MPAITLTSDWNRQDHYVAAIKGKLLYVENNYQVVEITNNIKLFNSSQAAFIIKNSYPWYPENSIHLILVNTDPGNEYKILLVEANGHFFIGTDNGVFSMILGETDCSVYEIEYSDNMKHFISVDLFTEIALRVAGGEKPENIGKKVNGFTRKIPIRATIDDNSLTGGIVYIDSFQNAITNISKNLFERIGRNRKFRIYVQSKHYVIEEINNSYSEVPSGELLAIFNSSGMLEIAINNGNAASLLNLSLSSTIRIEFDE